MSRKRFGLTTEEESIVEQMPKMNEPGSEDEVFAALEVYERAQHALAEVQATAMVKAHEEGQRIPKRGDLIEYFIEKDHGDLLGLVSEVLFVHAPTIVTLVTTKHEGARHTHANVKRIREGQPKPGCWDYRL